MKRILLLVAGAAVLAAPAAAAATAPTFALVPQHYDPKLRATESYFVAQAVPGTTFTNSVRVSNQGGTGGSALLYAVDATTGQTSGAVYLDRTKPRRDVGAWIELGKSSVSLGPGQSVVVPFTVHVPAGAHPGDHLGGIVAENQTITHSTGKGALQIRIRHLTIVAVEVQVPGPTVARVDVTAVKAAGQHGYQFVDLHLVNTGSVTTKPTGTLLVTDSSGAQVASRALKLDSLLPGTTIDYPVLLPAKALQPGSYHATVDLTFGADQLGYRRTPGTTQSITHGFDFTVSNGQYKQVFQGVKPVQPVQQAKSSSGSGSTLMLIVAGLAVLLAALVVLVLALRRWPHR
ncbi:MAG TPA: DUF916 domain-containing protein [Gaiellaceae bacterium]|nr:DUF916 domain-containing protein [Gaiellaceae bacterium]